MTTETTAKKPGRKKKAAATATVDATSTTCTCDCGEQIELLTASCKNLDEKMTTLIQYIKTFNQFLNQSMIWWPGRVYCYRPTAACRRELFS